MLSFRSLAVTLIFGGATSVALPAFAQKLDRVLTQQSQAQQSAAASQDRIDAIADQTDSLVDAYRETLRRIESLKIYNAQLERLIVSQQEEMTSQRQQIDDVTVVARDIRPLMARMIDTLDRFVQLDVPFLADERRQRVDFLKALMERADVTDAERYRRVLEAYQVESDYGRNIEAYAGELEVDGELREVDFLSIGRVALIYQTRDEARSGVWDQQARAWQDLDGSYRSAVRRAFRVARKQVAPDLLTLPVPAPRGVGE